MSTPRVVGRPAAAHGLAPAGRTGGRGARRTRRLRRPRPARLIGSLLLPLAAAACAGGAPPSDGPAGGDGPARADAAAPDWTRRVAPFAVRGPEGEAYGYPFLGGLNVPRPQFVDVDGDGDLDLFLQERSDDVMFFENTAAAVSEPEFVWRTDKFRGLDVGEWFRFVDMDADGDPDLLTEQPFSLMRYFRNDGDRFVLAADTLRDTEGEPLFSDRQNIPNVTDIDCDGLPDLFVGRLEGTITRFEAAEPVEGEELPAFEHLTDNFEGIEIVAEVVGSLHGANSMVFADVDGDGDADLFWGDFFEAGLLLIENRGSVESARGAAEGAGAAVEGVRGPVGARAEGACGAPELRGEPVGFPPGDPVETSGFNVPAVADVDADGDLDVLIGVLGGAYNPSTTAADNLYYFENTGGGYTLRTRRYLGTIDLGTESQIAAGDVDGDGDPDLLAAAKQDPEELTTSRVVLFENTGTVERPSLQLADTLDLGGSYHFSPELADLDGDGDLDLLLGTWNDGVRIAWNEGDAREPRWVMAESPLVELTRGSHTVPAAGDIDGDGDLDLIVGESVGALNLFRNTGTAQEPRFELVSDEYAGIDVGRRSAPAFTDLDRDDSPDLVIGHEDGGPACFLNEDGGFAPMEDCGLPALLPLSAPAFVDIDGDGDLDLFSGTLSGGVTFHERRGR